MEEAEHVLTKLRDNKKLLLSLSDEEAAEWIEEAVLARDVARETVEALQAQDGQRFEKLPKLWAEWSAQDRAEFLAKVVREVILYTAEGRRVPVAERASVRLYGADIEDRFFVSFAGSPNDRRAQAEAALRDYERQRGEAA